MQIKSPTYDEPHHILAGHLALKKQEFGYMAENPPLLKALIALPVLSFDLQPPDLPIKFSFLEEYEYATRFLFQPGSNVDQIIFLARLPIVFLSALLGYYVFLWARRLYGDKAGLFALTLYVFSPNILAHSRLTTLDLGVTCLIFITCYYFWDYLNDFLFRKYCLSALFLGLALVSKFTAVILFPILFLMLTVSTFIENKDSGRGLFKFKWRGEPQRSSVILLKHISVPLLLIVVMIFIAYGFRPDALVQFKKGWETLFQSMDKYKGINYLLGKYYSDPQWYYPVVVLLAKTPVPIFILWVVALGSIQRMKKEFSGELCLLSAIALILILSAFDSIHMGLRRFLPLYPFLFVFLGKVIKYAEAPHLSLFNKPVIKPAVVILLTWYLFASIKTFPDYLTYFNELAGGPENGINILDNTNIDWGQDLKRLKPFMDKRGIEKIKLLYHGTSDPEYYKIKTEPLTDADYKLGPQPGYYAISANILPRIKNLGVYLGLGPGWNLTKKEPIGVIGHTIYIFNFNSP